MSTETPDSGIGPLAVAEMAPTTDPVAIFKKVGALQALSSKLVLQADEEEVWPEIVDEVARIIGCEFCVLFVHDKARRCLVAKANCGYDPKLIGHRILIDSDSSPQGHAFREEYLVNIDDLTGLPADARLGTETRSELDIPIQGESRPLAVLHFGSRKPSFFTPQDLQICSLVVDQLSQAMANASLLEELTISRDAVIRGMAIMAESRDAKIGGHLDRICFYSEMMATELMRRPRAGYEVDRDFVRTIERAAALHDIGKVAVPEDILLKPDRLTAEEFEIIKTHTWRGEEILRRLVASHPGNAMLELGAEIARSHHEFWNGKGYPVGLEGDRIPLSARIVAICDVYDALISERSYKAAWAHKDAMAYVAERSGEQFDPWLIRVFLELEDRVVAARAEYDE